MPEGPEVYALAAALNKCGVPAASYGKHLFVAHEDWSFGLSGTVALQHGVLSKINKGFATGGIKGAGSLQDVVASNKLGVDWVTGAPEDLLHVVTTWRTSGKTLASLLLDQSQIAGIGVAWGSEVASAAGLDPRRSAASQSHLLSSLVDAMVAFRHRVVDIYAGYIARKDAADVVNGWFRNLYAIRAMRVYKVGSPVHIHGRTWWV